MAEQIQYCEVKKKKTHQGKKKEVKKRKSEKNVKMIFFYNKYKEEISTALQKANMKVEIFRGNKLCDL